MCVIAHRSHFASHFCLLTRTRGIMWKAVSGATSLVGFRLLHSRHHDRLIFLEISVCYLLYLKNLQDPSWPFLLQEALGSLLTHTDQSRSWCN